MEQPAAVVDRSTNGRDEQHIVPVRQLTGEVMTAPDGIVRALCGAHVPEGANGGNAADADLEALCLECLEALGKLGMPLRP